MNQVTTTSDYAHAVTADERTDATTAGSYSHARTAGDSAHATTVGRLAHALTAGDRAKTSATGENAIAAAFGANSSARAADGGFIVLAQYDGDTVVAVKTTQVGKEGIKPDTWYKLSPTGEFVEVEAA